MEIDVSSSYRPPDPKKQLSVRVRGSIHAKLEAIRDLWRERARTTGGDEAEIDTTFVVDALLADKTDEELAQWGGMPSTPAAKSEQLKTVGTAARKQH